MILFISNSLFSQNVLDGAYIKEHTLSRKVIPYSYLREADVMWSKKIWRVVDLNEKMNLPLKFPASKSMKDRRSLIDVIMDAVTEGTLTAYKPVDDEFTLPMTMEERKDLVKGRVDTIVVQQVEPPYNWDTTVIDIPFERDKVVAYRVKEEWFFDKQRSVMDVRILGIAPLIYEEDDQGVRRPDARLKPIFWVYFPEARKIFANAEVFNRFNDAERRTFDDIFYKRMFSSYIYKESNVYDRRIEDYTIGLDALLEAQRIKDDLFNLEHDVWEY